MKVWIARIYGKSEKNLGRIERCGEPHGFIADRPRLTPAQGKPSLPVPLLLCWRKSAIAQEGEAEGCFSCSPSKALDPHAFNQRRAHSGN